jgi:glycosyltransferase involved in cell wall biosynthesis
MHPRSVALTTNTPPLLYACEFDPSGYAVAARRYLRALRRVQQPVSWLPLHNTRDGRLPALQTTPGAPDELLALSRSSVAEAGGTVLAHCMPMSWQQLREQTGGTRFIGQTVWEADRIPARWHTELAAADEIWVPTEWNAETIRISGLAIPVHVVPHVVERVDASPPPLDVDASRFVFASICTWDRRKRPDLLLHAYLQAFTAADDVTLVLKTQPQVLSWVVASAVQRQTWWQVMQIVRQYQNPAEVVLVTDHWTDAEVAGLLQRADCYVSLTSVEGWGLGAFDAAVAGVPLIITGYGGQLEWLGADHPGLVPFTIAAADHPDRSMFEPGMTWAIADVGAAAEMMRTAADGTGGFVAAAPALATRLAQHYSEHAVGTTMKRLLG